MRTWLLMFALLPSAVDLCARTATIYSENRRYWVVIEYNDSHNAVVRAALHGTEKGRTRTLWKKEYDDLPTDYKSGVIVGNDGKFFAVVAGDQIMLFTPDNEKEITRDIEKSDLASNELVASVGMLNGRESIRFWSLGKNAWRAVTLPDVKEVKVGADLQKQWNEIARDEILAKLETYEHERMRARLKETAPFAGRAIENLSPEQPAVRVSPMEVTFVAMLHDPRDRPLFERMVKKRKRREEAEYFSGNDPDGIFEVIGGDSVREQGDLLLAIYEGKLKPGEDGEFEEKAVAKRYYLGRVRGKIQLPAPIRAKPGLIRIFLVPESIKNGKWWNSDDIEELAQSLPERKGAPADLDDRVAYGFGVVMPGKYFLKAIWDKRPPLTDRHAAGPGDYESDWFGPIELTAGASVTNLIVHCAGRAKGGNEYYAADEQTFAAWKAGDLSPSTYSMRGREIFSKAASEWIIKTNVALAAELGHLTRIAVLGPAAGVAQNTDDVSQPQKSRLMIYLQGSVGGADSLQICDENGEPLAAGPRGYKITEPDGFLALEWPREAKTFRIVCKGCFDYTLTNLTLNAQLPASR